jgi:hypothetical protein
VANVYFVSAKEGSLVVCVRLELVANATFAEWLPLRTVGESLAALVPVHPVNGGVALLLNVSKSPLVIYAACAVPASASAAAVIATV